LRLASFFLLDNGQSAFPLDVLGDPPRKEVSLYPGLYLLEIDSDRPDEAARQRYIRVRSAETVTVRRIEDVEPLFVVQSTYASAGERLSLKLHEVGATEPAIDVELDAVEPGVFETRARVPGGRYRLETRLGTREPIAREMSLPTETVPLIRLRAD
jgi:hypothetical protein